MRRETKRSLYIIAAFLALFLHVIGCATSTQTDVEETRYALDRGDWNRAIEFGEDAMANDPGNVEAALMLSAAYAGRGGLVLSKLAKAVAEATRTRDLFDVMQDLFWAESNSRLDPYDLRLAIDTLLLTLTPTPSTTNPLYKDHRFQHGLLLIVEVFLLPAILAQPEADDPVAAENIGEAVTDWFEEDLLEADDAFTAADIADDDPMVQNIRSTWCVLRTAGPDADGFDVRALRDLIRCQLSPNDGADLQPTDFEMPGIASCDDFAYDACDNAGPTTL